MEISCQLTQCGLLEVLLVFKVLELQVIIKDLNNCGVLLGEFFRTSSNKLFKLSVIVYVNVKQVKCKETVYFKAFYAFMFLMKYELLLNWQS